MIAKLDKYHLIILDNLAHVRKDQAETSVLFELINAIRAPIAVDHSQPALLGNGKKVSGSRHDRRRDCLVHHATIFEMNLESFAADF
jgi:hypothetical protein